MRAVLKVMSLAAFAVALSACALLAPMGRDDDARRAAKVTLAAYATTQQAMLIYGRLPDCAPEATTFALCKKHDIWAKIKAADKLAVTAITQATPVLNGAEADAGQLLNALAAIQTVHIAVKEASDAMKAPIAPPGST